MVFLRGKRVKSELPPDEDPGRFVLLFALWWFFDMAFVWISPHSYEQYYLPLNASSAVLGGYLVGLYTQRLRTDKDSARWAVLGLLGLILMFAMSWHIFFGIATSPHTGTPYMDSQSQPIRTRGYVQKWQEIAMDGQYDWMQVGDYIRTNSEPSDPLYVWGWVPGIYVQAQRMSPTPKPFEGMMHTLPPQRLAERVHEIVASFEKNPPKFIVDTRKVHFPWNRRPLELWPSTPDGFVPANDDVVRQFDQMYTKLLSEQVEPAEAQRYEAMQPLRSYVMKNYQIAGRYGRQLVLFKRK